MPASHHSADKPDDSVKSKLESSNVKDPKLSKLDTAVERLDTIVSPSTGNENSLMAVKSAVDTTSNVEAISQIMEGSEVLMQVLTEVAKIHPFIALPVGVFKIVWTLAKKQQENNQKIRALHLEMRKMIEVLLTLKDVSDEKTNGTPFASEMLKISEKAATDIQDCANTCDIYSKQKTLVKVLKGPVWEGRLLQWVRIFQERRSEFGSTFQMLSFLGTHLISQTLVDLDAKMERMMALFQTLKTTKEKDLTKLINLKGGPKKCESDKDILKELNEYERTATEPLAHLPGAVKSTKLYDLNDLKKDLGVDPAEAISKNLVLFTRKFEVQKSQLVDNVDRIVTRESDRLVSVVTKMVSGPGDKIVDRDVYELWNDMGWRGNVKARHFVLALRDYYRDKWRSQKEGSECDIWTLEYLDVSSLQSVRQAFDDDASGFITVAEVNAFTSSRPVDWSLPQWIAFWAIGWKQSLADYGLKIRELVGKMFTALPDVLPQNRRAIDDYLTWIYDDVTSLELPLRDCDIDETLQVRFTTYLEAEESRLHCNLKRFNYRIDAVNTLSLITGPKCIEKYLLPLLYLLLKRHLEIIRICQHRTVSTAVLRAAAISILTVMDAVRRRVNDLTSTFIHQRLDPGQQFRSFAHGLFTYAHDPAILWSAILKESVGPEEYPAEDDDEITEDVIAECTDEADTETSEQGDEYLPDHHADCSGCKSDELLGARITCLVCYGKTKWDSVDFCQGEGCDSATVDSGNIDNPHFPNHDLLKVRTIIFNRNFTQRRRQANDALKRARTIIRGFDANAKGISKSTFGEEAAEQRELSLELSPPGLSVQPRLSVKAQSAPECGVCKESVRRPFWFCAECEDGVFICTDCEMNGPEFDRHPATHDIVKCVELQEKVDQSTEGRIAALGECFAKHERRFTRHEERCARHEEAMQEKMAKLEGILGLILQKVEGNLN